MPEIARPDARVTPFHKGLGPLRSLSTRGDRETRVELLREDLSLPTAILSQEKLLHNTSGCRSSSRLTA